VRINGELLPDADIVSILRNWTAGDLASMAAAVGVVLHFLATHADVQQSLRAGRGDAARAVDEMLRIDDPFLVSRRVTTRDTSVEGYELEAGKRVYLNWTSANRDEAVFADPDAYRPEENAARNLVYGTGIHVCPGRPLATLELVVLVETLLASTASVELAGEGVRETYPLGGWRNIPVRLR
jgi:cytochrome P450